MAFPNNLPQHPFDVLCNGGSDFYVVLHFLFCILLLCNVCVLLEPGKQPELGFQAGQSWNKDSLWLEVSSPTLLAGLPSSCGSRQCLLLHSDGFGGIYWLGNSGRCLLLLDEGGSTSSVGTEKTDKSKSHYSMTVVVETQSPTGCPAWAENTYYFLKVWAAKHRTPRKMHCHKATELVPTHSCVIKTKPT